MEQWWRCGIFIQNVDLEFDGAGQTFHEDAHADEDAQTELILKKTPEGSIELIFFVDHKQVGIRSSWL